jgi:hypothetical protein
VDDGGSGDVMIELEYILRNWFQSIEKLEVAVSYYHGSRVNDYIEETLVLLKEYLREMP